MVNSALFETRRGVPFMSHQSPFKWRHFESEIILLCVRWYLRSSLSSRDLEEMMLERGLQVDHTTISRWGKPLRSGTGQTMPTSFQSHDRLLESRRNVHQSPPNLDGSVSSSRLAR